MYEGENIIIISIDGNSYCATLADFVNLAESPAGFGDTPEEATINLMQNL